MERLQPKYWNDLYENKETAWDIGCPSTPLKEYIDQLTNKDVAILIPGCGNSYEAEYLLANGFTNITLIDISTLLTSALEKKFAQYIGKQLTVITGNFFDLKGRFDLVLEQTFFCALDPTLRKPYVEKMHELLNSGGKIAGVMFNRSFDDSPPFGGSEEEYVPLFEKHFEIIKMEKCYNSIEKRSGNELFVIMKKKD